jgi:hypothetical protein
MQSIDAVLLFNRAFKGYCHTKWVFGGRLELLVEVGFAGGERVGGGGGGQL